MSHYGEFYQAEKDRHLVDGLPEWVKNHEGLTFSEKAMIGKWYLAQQRLNEAAAAYHNLEKVLGVP